MESRLQAIINAARAVHKVNVGPPKSEPSAVLASQRRRRGCEARSAAGPAMGVRTGHGIVEAGTIPDIDESEGEPKPQGRGSGR